MIPFNKPYLTGGERPCIDEAMKNRRFAGDGAFSRKCAAWLTERAGCRKAILVPSGTAALEMMMLLAGIGAGDEVIMPSFTFSSTANAAVLRGATPVFVDVRPDTMNIDERLIEGAITARTKAICPVYYAGAPCDIEAIEALAERRGLLVLPDAAQAIMSERHGRALCSFGHMSALSFHETKNIHCGEGGALLINDPRFVERAEIVMEKGTDRSKFLRGEVDKYTWVDVGSSFLMNEITAAFLWAQLERADEIAARRLAIWDAYREALEPLEKAGALRLCARVEGHNGHIFWVALPAAARDGVMSAMKAKGIGVTFHYVPLHAAPMMKRPASPLPVTEDMAARLLRLPLYFELTREELDQVVKSLEEALRS
jgi:dTDP-4-amino-4,6-dideoxygalactose transaminase